MPSEIELLTARVGRLERSNRRLRRMGAGFVLAAAALVLKGFAAKPRRIEAETIVIRDSRNRGRITIGTSKFAGGAFDLKPDSPAIWLSDENGSDRAILTADGLYLADGRARPLVELSSGPDRPELRFHAPDGKVLWSAP